MPCLLHLVWKQKAFTLGKPTAHQTTRCPGAVGAAFMLCSEVQVTEQLSGLTVAGNHVISLPPLPSTGRPCKPSWLVGSCFPGSAVPFPWEWLLRSPPHPAKPAGTTLCSPAPPIQQ